MSFVPESGDLLAESEPAFHDSTGGPGRPQIRRLIWVFVLAGVAGLWLVQFRLFFFVVPETRATFSQLSAADDFAHYYFAAKRAFNGDPVYCVDITSSEIDILSSANVHEATNPPVLVLLTAPLGALPQRTAWAVWNTLSCGSYLIALSLLFRAIELPVPLRFGIYSCLPLWGPLLVSLRYSQAQMLLTAGVIVSFLLIRRNQPRLGGIVFGCVVAIKLLPIALFAFFVGRRSWKLLLISVSAFIVVTSATQLHPGLAFRDYSKCASTTIATWAETSTFNQSVPALLRYLLFALLGSGALDAQAWSSVFAILVTIHGGLAVCLLLYLGHRSRGQSTANLDVCFSGALFVSVVLAPLAWTFYYVLLLPCLVIVLNYLRTRDSRRAVFAVLFSLPFAPWVLDHASAHLTLSSRMLLSSLTWFPGIATICAFAWLWRQAWTATTEDVTS